MSTAVALIIAAVLLAVIVAAAIAWAAKHHAQAVAIAAKTDQAASYVSDQAKKL